MYRKFFLSMGDIRNSARGKESLL